MQNFVRRSSSHTNVCVCNIPSHLHFPLSRLENSQYSIQNFRSVALNFRIWTKQQGATLSNFLIKIACLFNLQLLWEIHTGFPTIDIANSLSTFTPQVDPTKRSFEKHKKTSVFGTIPSLPASRVYSCYKQIRIIDPFFSIVTLQHCRHTQAIVLVRKILLSRI